MRKTNKGGKEIETMGQCEKVCAFLASEKGRKNRTSRRTNARQDAAQQKRLIEA